MFNPQKQRDLDIEQFTNLVCYHSAIPSVEDNVTEMKQLLDDLVYLDELGEEKIRQSNFDENVMHDVRDNINANRSNIMADLLHKWAQIAYSYDKNSKALMMRAYNKHIEEKTNNNE